MLAVINAAGVPRRWAGGEFHHCFDAGLTPYRQQLETIADRVSALSGTRRTQSGACNVEWVSGVVPGEVRPAFSILFGTDTAIMKVTVHIQDAKEIMEHRPAAALHEGGHILGLWHSDRRTDCMHPEVIGADFSTDELAVLAWIYGR